MDGWDDLLFSAPRGGESDRTEFMRRQRRSGYADGIGAMGRGAGSSGSVRMLHDRGVFRSSSRGLVCKPRSDSRVSVVRDGTGYGASKALCRNLDGVGGVGNATFAFLLGMGGAGTGFVLGIGRLGLG